MRWTTARSATPWLLGVLGLLFVAAAVGDTLSAVLVVHSPLLLVALNPRARNVLLASRTVAAGPLFVISLARRLVSTPVLYRLGRIHGDASLAWIDLRFPRSGRWVRRVERWFDRAPLPIVVLFPGAVTAYLAGSTGMHEATLLLLSTIGMAARLGALHLAGDALDHPLNALLGFIAAHQALLIALSLALTVFQVVRIRARLRRPRAGDVELLGRAADSHPLGADPLVGTATIRPSDAEG